MFAFIHEQERCDNHPDRVATYIARGPDEWIGRFCDPCYRAGTQRIEDIWRYYTLLPEDWKQMDGYPEITTLPGFVRG